MRLSMIVTVGTAGLYLAACGSSDPEAATYASEDSPATAARSSAPAGTVTTDVSSDGLPTMTKVMDFQTCLGAIRTMASDLGVVPINIVETSEVRIVRFNTADGSVLVTCSAADGKMVAVQSPHQG
jgi:hypothetical protein